MAPGTTEQPPSGQPRSLLIVLALLALAAVAGGLTLSSVVIERRVGSEFGLLETVFSTPDFQGPPVLRRQDSSFDPSFSDGGIAAPGQFFSVRWEGFWDVGPSGAVDIYASGDDRVAVFVDEALVLERRTGMRTAGRSLRLSGGVHRLRVEYEQDGGGVQLKVLSASADGSPRPLRRESLFARSPDPDVLSAARRASVLRSSATIAWSIVSLVLAVVLGTFGVRHWLRLGVNGRLSRIVRRLHERYGAWTEQQSPAGRTVFAVVIAAVTLSAIFARLPGLNPQSLWYDDLAWATLMRVDSLSAMLRIPSHAPPGFLALLRASRYLFSDPEWSVQLPAFIGGVAAIPVMALVTRRLTRSQGLAILAAALTALNPLLAHYTLYVKHYSIDFLMTSTLLLASATLLNGRDIPPSRVAEVTLFSAFALLFSVASVFVSFPVMSVIILQVLLARKRDTRAVLLMAATFALILVAGFFLFRSRTSELMGYDFRRYFFGKEYDFPRVWSFLSTQGRRIVETSLPSWKETDPWDPTTVSWTLPFVGLGLVWLFVRRSSRPMGWIVLGFMVAFFVAAFTSLYPLSNDRRGIFAFPVFICLAVMGFHLVTEWLPRREVVRLVAGLGVAVFALYAPIHPQYWGVDDARLIQRVSALPSGDGLILSPAGAYLAGYYGPWPIRIARRGERRIDGEIGIVRNLTVISVTRSVVEGFLGRARPAHLWYVAFRTSDEAEDSVLQVLNERGYAMEQVELTSRGTLYLGVLR